MGHCKAQATVYQLLVLLRCGDALRAFLLEHVQDVDHSFKLDRVHVSKRIASVVTYQFEDAPALVS